MMIYLFFMATMLICWEPKCGDLVYGRKIIYITNFHILFDDGSILKRYEFRGTSSFIQQDYLAAQAFYYSYKGR